MVNSQRGAFSLIELIIAIVLIAIVVTAVPQMISSNSKGTEEYLKQEVVAAAAGEAFRIISYPWDDNSIDDTNRSFVLDATAPGTDNLSRTDAKSRIRVGMVAPVKGTGALSGDASASYHRLFYNSVTAPASGALSGIAAVDSSLLSDTGAQGYKSVYTAAVSSGYVSDGGGSSNFNFSKTTTAGRTNLKTARLDVTSSTATNNPVLSLWVFSANIGSTKYYTRDDL